jgi:CheY-like chemotaxis protein
MSSTQILIAEDERIVGRALQKELEDCGYTVSGFAATAQDAVDKAVATKPDLVLMDIHLQGERDGIDAAREIYLRCSIPVIYLSAYADAPTLDRAKNTGAFGYLLKPYEERELFTTIEVALAKHRADKKLQETERWLSATLAGIHDAVTATDVNLHIKYMNDAAMELTSVKSGEAFDASLAAVCHLVQGDRIVDLDELTQRAIREGKKLAVPPETRLIAGDNVAKAVEGGVEPIFDAAHHLVGVLLSLRDVTVRRELERLKHQNEKRQRLSQKMEALSRLAGGMARHLNDQLTAILCNTTLSLSAAGENPTIRAALRDTETAALRAADLVERLRVFSDHRQCELRPVDLNLILQQRLDRLQSMLSPSIDLVFQPGPGLWRVQADEVQIAQAILNLCLDARFDMPAGGQLTIQTDNVNLKEASWSPTAVEQVSKYVRVRVTDTGRGLPPDDCERVFEPIFTTGDPDQSVDLDLAIAFAIAEQHHGWIECQCDLGSGTQFDLYLPRYDADVPTGLRKHHDARPKGMAATILIADSDPLVREAGRRILESHGYHVLLVDNGDQVISMVEQQQPGIDLVLLDLNIPGQFGVDALQRLIQLDPNVRPLFSSGHFSEDRSESDGHTAGVINKPYRQDELINLVQRALGKPPAHLKGDASE